MVGEERIIGKNWEMGRGVGLAEGEGEGVEVAGLLLRGGVCRVALYLCADLCGETSTDEDIGISARAGWGWRGGLRCSIKESKMRSGV